MNSLMKQFVFVICIVYKDVASLTAEPKFRFVGRNNLIVLINYYILLLLESLDYKEKLR